MQIWKMWERDSIFGCFTPQALEETCRAAWWKDYPAEVLIDSFEHWSVYSIRCYCLIRMSSGEPCGKFHLPSALKEAERDDGLQLGLS